MELKKEFMISNHESRFQNRRMKEKKMLKAPLKESTLACLENERTPTVKGLLTYGRPENGSSQDMNEIHAAYQPENDYQYGPVYIKILNDLIAY